MNHRRRRRANSRRRPNPGTPVEGFEALSESMRRPALNRPPPPLLERPVEQGYPFYVHPHDETSAAAGATSGGALWYPDRPGQLLCKQFLKYGSCKYGLTCKFNHPRQWSVQRVSLNDSGYPPQMYVPLNDSGYPLQMGGSVPSGIASQYIYEPYGPMFISPHMVPNWGWTHFSGGSVPSGFASQYMHEPYGPRFVSPQMVPNPGWTHFPAPINPLASSSAPVYQGAYPTMYSTGGPSGNSRENHMFPERPGQPLCLAYMRTGKCVFPSGCRLHHPPERFTSCALSPIGLPLRPEAPPCDFYVLHGSCDYGSSCIFDHPYDPSAASSSEPGQSRRSRRERHI